MHEIFLEVRISNLPALAMYRNLGFSVKGIRKDYYSEPKEDAYIMSLVSEEIRMSIYTLALEVAVMKHQPLS